MSLSKPASEDLNRLRQEAWLGDAVLELYVRGWVLRERGQMDAEMKTRFTCNQFLNCTGNPTKVEAQIGTIYRDHGLDAAFDWIRANLEPLFIKQESARRKR